MTQLMQTGLISCCHKAESCYFENMALFLGSSCFSSSVCLPPRTHRETHPTGLIVCVFLGGSRQQVNGTPQKGFVRPEQLLEGKVS